MVPTRTEQCPTVALQCQQQITKHNCKHHKKTEQQNKNTTENKNTTAEGKNTQKKIGLQK